MHVDYGTISVTSVKIQVWVICHSIFDLTLFYCVIFCSVTSHKNTALVILQ